MSNEPRCEHCKCKLSKGWHEPGCPERENKKNPSHPDYDPMAEEDPEKLKAYLDENQKKAIEAKLEIFKRAWTGFAPLHRRVKDAPGMTTPFEPKAFVSCVEGGYVLFTGDALTFIPDRSKELLTAGLGSLGGLLNYLAVSKTPEQPRSMANFDPRPPDSTLGKT